MNKKVLLIIESCNPDWASVPLVGYHFYHQIKQFSDVTLVTHDRNRTALEQACPNENIVYIKPKKIETAYYRVAVKLSSFKGRVIWPIRHFLCFPLYFYFDAQVRAQFSKRVLAGEFDLVHALTPMMPRYPVSIVYDCKNTPFILGPVNGGVPFPPAFKAVGIKEFSQFNFLRDIGRWLIPHYRSTYRLANRILAGSTFTKQWIETTLNVPSTRTALVYENAVPDDFYESRTLKVKNTENHNAGLALLFVGRLVPYKGCDMLLKAVAKIDTSIRQTLHLTVVGDGSERHELEALVAALGITHQVTFTGWIAQTETKTFYKQSDVFCFPSVREFGGAVVMEAMAVGLPCIVVNNGGIGEYVDDQSGYRIDPRNETYVIDQLATIITSLATDPNHLNALADAAYARGQTFSWSNKGLEIQKIYEQFE